MRHLSYTALIIKQLQDWHNIVMSIRQNNTLEALIVISSPHNVKETIDLLVLLLGRLNMTIYARINRQTESRCRELETRAMECLLYDNPELSSPAVQRYPTLALYFPMKLVAWEDHGCYVAFIDPEIQLQKYSPEPIGFHWPDLRANIARALAT